MLFLIDYENVGNAGMKGCGYLDARDYVIVFYSEARRHMEQRILEQVTASGCAFEICKLYKAGKNALDFYIASRLGELIGGGDDGIGRPRRVFSGGRSGHAGGLRPVYYGVWGTAVDCLYVWSDIHRRLRHV